MTMDTISASSAIGYLVAGGFAVWGGIYLIGLVGQRVRRFRQKNSVHKIPRLENRENWLYAHYAVGILGERAGIPLEKSTFANTMKFLQAAKGKDNSNPMIQQIMVRRFLHIVHDLWEYRWNPSHPLRELTTLEYEKVYEYDREWRERLQALETGAKI
jgi:hypothetical protein